MVEGNISEKELANLKQDTVSFRNRAFQAGLYSKEKSKINKNFRNSFVYFPKVSEFKYGYNLLQSLIITNYYHIYSKFDYDRLSEIQYCIYFQGGKFKKHNDCIRANKETIRCLTMSINISEENEYENGELVIYTKEKQIILSKKPGSFVIFPSFYSHEALEVTKGKRESIVTWLHSPIQLFEDFEQKVKNL